jgi:hypothetical protein
MSALLPPRFLFRYRLAVARRDGLPRQQQALLGLGEEDRLSDLSLLDDAPAFADLRIAWNLRGMGFSVDVSGKHRPPQCLLEKPAESDGLQVWIDTRDTKTIHRAGRFCHWFCLLPCGDGPDAMQPMGIQLPVPRAREDAPICEPEAILISSELRKNGYRLEAWLSAEVLNGFDPHAQPGIGFNFLVRDAELGTQSLAVAGDYPSESDPSLWATLELTGTDE